ncbi:MAG: ribonuclease HII [Methyloversatilis sp.]|nr:ribonuclease HII [Methyloversatilis sp.]MBP6193213.1 ribonuclease HII [Methyloversatilis sp.]MBP9117646.1 ribonuclease HII [Methyloversatilis sp.]
MDVIAGVDEAGRGPLCGPVYAAAVILDPARPIAGLNDSKKLSEKKREALAPLIRERAVAWAIGIASVDDIDRLNILHASMLAMRRAIEGLRVVPLEVLIDGNRMPTGLAMPARAIVGGDALEQAISAASILAKTDRDHEMLRLAVQYPQYGIARHKGYPTPEHLAALREHGPSPIHRRSFAPVAQSLLDFGDMR